MQVQGVNSSLAFQAQKRILNKEQMGTVKELLTQMNAETVCKRGEYTFESKILKSLHYKNNATFIDNRIILYKVPENKQMVKQTLFTVGKTELVIDNKSGQIINYKKPLLTSWKRVIKNIDKYLKIFKENFNNPEIVKKKTVTLEGFTPAGYAIVKRVKKGMKYG